MAIGSGVAARMIYAKEPTQNTREVPDHHVVGLVQENVTGGPARIQSNALRARRFPAAWAAGNKIWRGPISMELVPQSMGEWLELCWGGVSTAGSDPYTHTVTPGDMSSSTIQLIRPSSDGTERVFEYTGCMVESGSLSVDAAGDGSLVNLSTNIVAHDQTTNQSAVAASYPATPTFWSSVETSMTIGGSAYPFHSVTMNWDNALRVQHEMASAAAGQAVISEAGFHNVTFDVQADFDDLTELNYYLNGTENALVLLIDDGTYSLTITTNVRYDGDNPIVDGPDVLTMPLQAVGTSATSDAAVFTAALVNGDSAA